MILMKVLNALSGSFFFLCLNEMKQELRSQQNRSMKTDELEKNNQ